MKKIFTYILGLTSLCVMSSCEMDQPSTSSIPFDRAFSDLGAIESLERGAYSRLRTTYSLNAMIAADIQTDYAHAVNGFSNTYGNLYRWVYTADASEVEDTWNNLYGGIGFYNFIIDGITSHLGFEPTASEEASLNRILGTAYLMRAMSYTMLAERFCGAYDGATATKEYSGVPLAKTYDTGNTPARSNLEDTYALIIDDLKQAEKLLYSVAGSANSTTLHKDCVTAMQARVYLLMGEYGEALKKASQLIGNSTYSLAGSPDEFRKMWEYDESPETLFQFYASTNELAYTWGYYFCSDYYNGTNPDQHMMMPDYIPTKTCLDMFEEGDWRRSTYFVDCSADTPIDGVWWLPYIKGQGMLADNLVLFYKYPGNPDLRTSSSWNYYNTWKVFRIAEMYLIAAEAALQTPGGDALTPLNALREHRGLEKLEGDVTLKDVQDERYREMLLEGNRLTDIKRWGLDLQRGEPQTGLLSATGGNPWKQGTFITELDSDLRKEAGHYMFVWPIPESEIFANQQLASQQNPGWKR